MFWWFFLNWKYYKRNLSQKLAQTYYRCLQSIITTHLKCSFFLALALKTKTCVMASLILAWLELSPNLVEFESRSYWNYGILKIANRVMIENRCLYYRPLRLNLLLIILCNWGVLQYFIAWRSQLHIYAERDHHKRAYFSSNMKNVTPYKFVTDLSHMTRTRLIWILYSS
jgi:hypothetical protein